MGLRDKIIKGIRIQLTDDQREIMSKIFADLTKAFVIGLGIGQFISDKGFNLRLFIGGVIAAVGFFILAVIYARKKGGKTDGN